MGKTKKTAKKKPLRPPEKGIRIREKVWIDSCSHSGDWTFFELSSQFQKYIQFTTSMKGQMQFYRSWVITTLLPIIFNLLPDQDPVTLQTVLEPCWI